MENRLVTDPRKAAIQLRLEATRARTLALLERVAEADLPRRIHEFYSPPGWHFGHIGRTEEAWVLSGGTDEDSTDDRLAFLFTDRPDNPKSARVHLPPRDGIVAYLARTRERTLEALDRADLDTAGLLNEGYAWVFADGHECQHQETIAELLHLLARTDHPPQPDGPPLMSAGDSRMVELPGGKFLMGSRALEAYDNEALPHEVSVRPFRLAANPVTVAEWNAFRADRGPHRRELWSDNGWQWRQQNGGTEYDAIPEYQSTATQTYGLTGLRPLAPDQPVMGIGAHEADAFARWRGLRLPTEAEWEFAASRIPGLFPWGDHAADENHAVFGLTPEGPMSITAAPQGRTPDGIGHLAGNVWEWTASAFLPYPGYEAFPYDGYSKAHMDGLHRVCRGGSWATSPAILRRTFRNWYVPGYRQGFLGLRLAGDLDS
ncbi:MAG: hypothetical protein C4320_08215 [Armatimonadota bacterium]